MEIWDTEKGEEARADGTGPRGSGKAARLQRGGEEEVGRRPAGEEGAPAAEGAGATWSLAADVISAFS